MLGTADVRLPKSCLWLSSSNSTTAANPIVTSRWTDVYSRLLAGGDNPTGLERASAWGNHRRPAARVGLAAITWLALTQSSSMFNVRCWLYALLPNPPVVAPCACGCWGMPAKAWCKPVLMCSCGSQPFQNVATRLGKRGHPIQSMLPSRGSWRVGLQVLSVLLGGAAHAFHL